MLAEEIKWASGRGVRWAKAEGVRSRDEESLGYGEGQEQDECVSATHTWVTQKAVCIS